MDVVLGIDTVLWKNKHYEDQRFFNFNNFLSDIYQVHFMNSALQLSLRMQRTTGLFRH